MIGTVLVMVQAADGVVTRRRSWQVALLGFVRELALSIRAAISRRRGYIFYSNHVHCHRTWFRSAALSLYSPIGLASRVAPAIRSQNSRPLRPQPGVRARTAEQLWPATQARPRPGPGQGFPDDTCGA